MVMYLRHVLQAMLVHTAETVRFRYFIDLLMENRRPVMLVGNAGCGKTVLINDKLSSKPFILARVSLIYIPHSSPCLSLCVNTYTMDSIAYHLRVVYM